MIYLSASSIKDFLSCESRYWFRIHRSRESVQTKPMLVGSIAHNILEKYWDSKELALECIEDYYRQYSEEHILNKVDKNNLYLFVNTFFDKFRFMVGNDDEIEKNFKLEIEKDVYLVGKLDRVIEKRTVIDWKTGTKSPTSNALSRDIQFIVYDYAFKRLYDKSANNLLLASLSTGKLIKYNHIHVYETILFDEIIPSMISTIKRDEFPRTGYINGGCYRCTFKEYCHQHF